MSGEMRRGIEAIGRLMENRLDEIEVLQEKLAAAQARIAEMLPELKVLRECEQHWLERDKAHEAYIAELEARLKRSKVKRCPSCPADQEVF